MPLYKFNLFYQIIFSPDERCLETHENTEKLLKRWEKGFENTKD